ncbi:MAG: hypothetical protein PHD88_09250 [Firmicutes bacterium]|nr:hypothetical protein [Bacillota bacterium]MDD4263542.1 hypothetical protein [Bacillota bacterium]MDD4694559.1 hypothetical protein [Bacillota bacterium]
MRKLFPFLLLIVLLVSGLAFADDVGVELNNAPTPEEIAYAQHVNDDGVIIVERIGSQYVILDYIQNRTGGYYKDVNGKNPQSTQLTIRTEAYIPCYIKMTVTGNYGNSVLESFGPGAEAITTARNYFLLFDNEVGGYVDGDWGILGHGRNAEIAPGDDVFIQACDQIKVEVYANDTFQYDVIASALKAAANVDTEIASNVLPLHMRYSVDSGDWIEKQFLTLDQETVLIAERPATDSVEALHQFRVPYTTSTAHGQYDGKLILKAYTI